MKYIPLFVLLLTFIGCTQPTVPENKIMDPTSAIFQEFEERLQKDIRDDGLNGSISVAVVKKDQVLWSKAFGVADIENNTSAGTNTIYRTASISKPFTAFLMMQLYQKGIIDLDDPIEKYFPEIKNLRAYSDETKITFRQVATHLSGLQREPDLPNADQGPINEWENKILESIPTSGFRYKPGTRHYYSNIGYATLGLSLGRAANKSFMELIETEIFQPLGMNSSFFIVPDQEFSRVAKGIEGGPRGAINYERPRLGHAGRGFKVPNGGIYSTPNDLAKFMMCNLGYMDLLSKENIQLMQTPTEPIREWRNNGLGFFLYKDDKLNLVEHNGSISGYTANFVFDRDSQYGVIIMRNYNWGSTNLELQSTILIRKLNELEKK